MNDTDTLAMIVADTAANGGAGAMIALPEASLPTWLQNKSREERVLILTQVQHVVDLLGGVAVINTAMVNYAERASGEMWRILDRVKEPDRQKFMEGMVAAATTNMREGMIEIAREGRTTLSDRISVKFSPPEQSRLIDRIFRRKKSVEYER